MNPPAGRAYWAVAPFSPRPPFRLYAGEGHAPMEVADPRQMTAAAKKGMSEFTLLTEVKVRPVLVVTGVLEPFDEVLALRLLRLEKLDCDDAMRVRSRRDAALLFLSPDAFPGLPVENAAILTALLRLPVAAIDTSAELGGLREDELRDIHERIVRIHGFDLSGLVQSAALDLLRRLKQR